MPKQIRKAKTRANIPLDAVGKEFELHAALIGEFVVIGGIASIFVSLRQSLHDETTRPGCGLVVRQPRVHLAVCLAPQ